MPITGVALPDMVELIAEIKALAVSRASGPRSLESRARCGIGIR